MSRNLAELAIDIAEVLNREVMNLLESPAPVWLVLAVGITFSIIVRLQTINLRIEIRKNRERIRSTNTQLFIINKLVEFLRMDDNDE